MVLFLLSKVRENSLGRRAPLTMTFSGSLIGEFFFGSFQIKLSTWPAETMFCFAAFTLVSIEVLSLFHCTMIASILTQMLPQSLLSL